jgi:hypothetical protein
MLLASYPQGGCALRPAPSAEWRGDNLPGWQRGAELTHTVPRTHMPGYCSKHPPDTLHGRAGPHAGPAVGVCAVGKSSVRRIAARGAGDSPRRAAQGDCRAEFPVDFTAGLPVDRLRALAGVTQQANKAVRVADPSVQPHGTPKEQMWNDAGIVLSQYVDSTKGLPE